MTARRDPDRLIHAFLMEGQTELADQVFDAVRAASSRNDNGPSSARGGCPP